jgi:hypothetical protein
VTLATAAATGTVLAFAPVVSTASCSSTSSGISSCKSSQESLVANEGAGVLLVLAVPALLALVPVVARTQRSTLVAAGALTLATLLGMASVGIFFIPTVVLAWVAVGTSGEVDRNLLSHRSTAQ